MQSFPLQQCEMKVRAPWPVGMCLHSLFWCFSMFLPLLFPIGSV
jgi:hypothetical protein